MTRIRMACFFAAFTSMAPRAYAQKAGDAGFLFQYPTAVGMIWHASNAFAVRPEMWFTSSSSSFAIPSGGASTSTSSNWSLAVSTLHYLSNRDNVRTYVSPKVTYGKGTSESSSTTSTTFTQSSFSLSFGAHYAAAPRFHVYGETGYGRSHFSDGDFDSDNWGPRSAVGMILYFGK